MSTTSEPLATTSVAPSPQEVEDAAAKELLAANAVRIIAIYDEGVDACVRDRGRDFDVSLTLDHSMLRSKLTYFCTCNDSSRLVCRHLQALGGTLAADEKGRTFIRKARGLEQQFRPTSAFSAHRDQHRAKPVPSTGGLVGGLPANYRSPYPPPASSANHALPVSLPKRSSAVEEPPPGWQQRLFEMRATNRVSEVKSISSNRATREIVVVLDVPPSHRKDELHVRLFERLTSSQGTTYRPMAISLSGIRDLPKADLVPLSLLSIPVDASYSFHYWDTTSRRTDFTLLAQHAEVCLRPYCEKGDCFWTDSRAAPGTEECRLLSWRGNSRATLQLRASFEPDQCAWRVQGLLVADEFEFAVDQHSAPISGGWMIVQNQIVRHDRPENDPWIRDLVRQPQLTVPVGETDEFLSQLWRAPDLPHLDFPPELRWPEHSVNPVPLLRVRRPTNVPASMLEKILHADIFFLYGQVECDARTPGSRQVDAEQRRLIVRDLAFEAAIRRFALESGMQFPRLRQGRLPSASYEFKRTQLNKIVQKCISSGWKVEAEGRLFRRPSIPRLSVSSQIDWLELEGAVDFDGIPAKLLTVLTAIRRGQQYVKLDDGSEGMIPEEWLQRYAGLARLAELNGDTVRFKPTQAMLLDALLEAQTQVDLDEKFQQIRARIREFSGIRPAKPAKSFCGELREYQQAGLGWLHFLREFGFGGCLADDMGLGKTVQVLALLDELRAKQAKLAAAPLTSLIVVPKSLVFNWIEEAARFTPQLRFLNFTGTNRDQHFASITQYDAVLTTYATLRMEIERLREITFEYAILDESQAVKNSHAQSSKACRLISARHRLAMTGTPIENHLGELWSLFEFLNPGMLGSSDTFQVLSSRTPLTDRVSDDSCEVDESSIDESANSETERFRGVLAKAIRPYVLRRTKQQVLAELPNKTEQTVYCEMDDEQRKIYNDIRDFYRTQLTASVAELGMAKSKFQVLEALLRLRQAACHPALLGPEFADERSTKLEMLMEQLEEILAEDHKALVFSQFTSLLDLLKKRLRKQKIPFEYLDGKTRDRKSPVDRFQNDANSRLFLISLKAGGCGLNLTAADYVFILDPWWNPAVEAQAIDRTHRIGQTRPVTAYRLICTNTVEEKILKLQETKRELADSIINADNGIIRNLTSDDLQLLLG